ncbi:MAG: AAA family ATPase [Candidatus Absconditabacterales bacterium]
MQYVVMTVGKTHSGKTTWGGQIRKTIKHCCLIDGDIIAEFLKTNYLDLYNTDYVKENNELTQGFRLKGVVFQGVYKHALQTTLPIILTNANSTKAIRKHAGIRAHKAGRKIIMIYFNRPQEVLLQRIQISNRSKKCLTKSKDFTDLLLNRQSKIFESPSTKEADIFFEITDDSSRKEVQKKVIYLLSKKKI